MNIKVLAIALAVTTGLSAQTIIDKNPKNKNAVLEIYCGKTNGYSPDGDKKADEFSAQNQGRVVVVKIHCGVYASGTPNYNVMYGSVNYGNNLYGLPGVDLKGFPGGTVNRRLFSGSSQGTGTAQFRGTWATTGTSVLAENSPVNVLIHPYHDAVNGKIEVYVEAYYTNGQSVASNRIHVGVMQDNVWGPQSGASNYYPARWNSSTNKYQNMDMLREVLTPHWGDITSNIGAGDVFQKVYSWSIPNQIGDVNVVPTDLKFYVFVSEDQQTILTGTTASISNNKLDYLPTSCEVTKPTPPTNKEMLAGSSITELDVTIKNSGAYPLISGAKIPITIGIGGVDKVGFITLSSSLTVNNSRTIKITDPSLLGAVPSTLGSFDVCVKLEIPGDMDPANNETCTSYISSQNPANKNLDVTDFNPKTGKVGTEVWIDGVGFDPVLSKNAISFNGVQTTQILATSTGTQLKVLVPTGATTGKIYIEALGEKDTSAVEFTVIEPLGLNTKHSGAIIMHYSNERLNVVIDSFVQEPLSLNVWNLSGQKVLSQVISETSSIELTELPRGSYVAKLGQKSLKFVR